MAKHFFKILTFFIAMIIIGLVGLFAINHFGGDGTQTTVIKTRTQVAK